MTLRQKLEDLKHNYNVQKEMNNIAYSNYLKIVNKLEQRNTELEQRNSILKNALIEREKQEKLNLLKWEELALSLEQRVKELEDSKVCNGCIWYDELHPSSCDCLEQCIRFKHGWDKDRYEQKDSE